MKNSLLFTILLALLAVSLTGCGIGSNPASSHTTAYVANPTQPAAEMAGSVSFKVVLPDSTQKDGLSSIRASSTEPEVRFKLVLVNIGSTLATTTLIMKTVPVVDNKATVTFTNVPPRTCIGEVEIINGNIGGNNTFHGAADLEAGKNTVIEVAAVGSKEDADIVAQVIGSIINNGDHFKKAVPDLASLILATIDDTIRSASDVYAAALNATVAKFPVFYTDWALQGTFVPGNVYEIDVVISGVGSDFDTTVVMQFTGKDDDDQDVTLPFTMKKRAAAGGKVYLRAADVTDDHLTFISKSAATLTFTNAIPGSAVVTIEKQGDPSEVLATYVVDN